MNSKSRDRTVAESDGVRGHHGDHCGSDGLTALRAARRRWFNQLADFGAQWNAGLIGGLTAVSAFNNIMRNAPPFE